MPEHEEPLLDELLALFDTEEGGEISFYDGTIRRSDSLGAPRMVQAKNMDATAMSALIDRIVPPEKNARLKEMKSCRFGYAHSDGARYEIGVAIGRSGPRLNIRRLPRQTYTFEQLGLPRQSIYPSLMAHRGLNVLAGLTRCGKSTSLYAMLEWMNQNRELNIHTLEECVSFVVESAQSLVCQRELERDTPTLAQGAIDAIADGADVLAIDAPMNATALETALRAVEAGLLVFVTVYPLGARQTIEYLVAELGGDLTACHRVSRGLRSVISQFLLPRANGKGRIAAFEIMHNTPAVANLIREGKTERLTSVIQTQAKLGMIGMDDYLMMLYRKGIIAGEICMEHAVDFEEMRKALQPSDPRGPDDDGPDDDDAMGCPAVLA